MAMKWSRCGALIGLILVAVIFVVGRLAVLGDDAVMWEMYALFVAGLPLSLVLFNGPMSWVIETGPSQTEKVVLVVGVIANGALFGYVIGKIVLAVRARLSRHF
jgi:hypothetical protein